MSTSENSKDSKIIKKYVYVKDILEVETILETFIQNFRALIIKFNFNIHMLSEAYLLSKYINEILIKYR